MLVCVYMCDLVVNGGKLCFRYLYELIFVFTCLVIFICLILFCYWCALVVDCGLSSPNGDIVRFRHGVGK